MSHRSLNQLRAERLHWKLSGLELARLLGLRNRCSTSRLERSSARPTAAQILACEVVFGVPASELFPDLYDSAQDGVMRRAAVLSRKLEGRKDRASVRKKALLARMAERAKVTDANV
jgi:transcriptional regulator with XRE-family HTH domain